MAKTNGSSTESSDSPTESRDNLTRSNDQAAWVREAIREHEGPLTRYAFRVTRDLERAREVVQETFLKLWQADRVKVATHTKEWLFTVCRNQALDMRRKDKRLVPLPDTPEPDPSDTAAAAPHAGAILEEHERESEVQQAFQSLGEKQKEVLRLKFQNGLSYAEISRITGLSVSNVGYIIHMGVKDIRKKLGGDA